MSAKELPPLDVLRNRVIYNPTTGYLKLASRAKPPTPDVNGYIRIFICGERYAGHRIAWALHYGVLPDPSMEIDHINGNRSDNRIENLRLVSQTTNLRNKTQYKNCKHGYPGILFEKGRIKCWRAQIGINGTIRKIGAFRCKTAAIVARKQAEVQYRFTGTAGDAKWQL